MNKARRFFCRALLFLKMALTVVRTKSYGAMEVVDHFFRHEHSKMIASFTSKFGLAHMESVEDAVQDALIKAMQVWPFHSIPTDPSGWIFRVANNRLIDKIRREHKIDRANVVEDLLQSETVDFKMPSEHEIEDDQLKMMFACCHQALSEETQIMLTLNLLCGFGTAEIARALLKKKDAVAKALTRGKSKFKNEVGTLQLPAEPQLRQRLQVVMKVIYLLFNEGYKVTKGEKLMDETLTSEAVRLGLLLLNRYANLLELNALIALMYFQASRFGARMDSKGNLMSMQEQDRNLWDREIISLGHRYLNASAGSGYLTEYHIQAGIAAIHCSAASFEETDWKELLRLYDLQVSFNRLPIAEMNRVVPLAKVEGPKAGLAELQRLRKYPKLLEHHLYHAIKAELLEESGNHKEAESALEKAVEQVTNNSEKKFLENKLQLLKEKLR